MGEIKGLKKDEAKLKKTIKNQEQVIIALRTNLTTEITGLKLNDSMQGETIQNLTMELNELKNDTVKQGKTISNLTVNLNDFKNDTVKQEKDIKKLKKDDAKQVKTIKKLNERVDELEKKECQIGIIESDTKGMKGYFSRNERDVQKIPT